MIKEETFPCFDEMSYRNASGIDGRTVDNIFVSTAPPRGVVSALQPRQLRGPLFSSVKVLLIYKVITRLAERVLVICIGGIILENKAATQILWLTWQHPLRRDRVLGDNTLYISGCRQR